MSLKTISRLDYQTDKNIIYISWMTKWMDDQIYGTKFSRTPQSNYSGYILTTFIIFYLQKEIVNKNTA